MLNKILMIGNLTFDPELRYTPSGQAVCNLRIANNRTYKTKAGEKKEDVIYLTVTAWGKHAERCAEYLKKGSMILVEGWIKIQTWDKGGTAHSEMVIQSELITFLTRTKEGAASDENTANASPETESP